MCTDHPCNTCRTKATELIRLEAEVRAEAARLGAHMNAAACRTLQELKAQALAFGMTELADAIAVADTCPAVPTSVVTTAKELASGGPTPRHLTGALAGKSDRPGLSAPLDGRQVRELLALGQGARLVVFEKASGKSTGTLANSHQNLAAELRLDMAALNVSQRTGKGYKAVRAATTRQARRVADALLTPPPPPSAPMPPRVMAYLAQEAELKAAELAAEAETAAQAEADRARAESLRLAAERSARAVRDGLAVPVVVDARTMRPLSPTLTAQRVEAEAKATEAADRKRAERAKELERLDMIAQRHRRGPSILGLPPEPEAGR